MRYDNPNRNVRLKPLNPRTTERELGSPGTGSVQHDGYRVVARTPRVKGYTESVAPDKAKRIEEVFKPINRDFDD